MGDELTRRGHTDRQIINGLLPFALYPAFGIILHRYKTARKMTITMAYSLDFVHDD